MATITYGITWKNGHKPGAIVRFFGLMPSRKHGHKKKHTHTQWFKACRISMYATGFPYRFVGVIGVRDREKNDRKRKNRVDFRFRLFFWQPKKRPKKLDFGRQKPTKKRPKKQLSFFCSHHWLYRTQQCHGGLRVLFCLLNTKPSWDLITCL